MSEASELVGGDGKPQRHSHRLLDLCVVAGLGPTRLEMLLKDLQQNGDDADTVSPEVLSVHAPPFISPQSARAGAEESSAPPGFCRSNAQPPSEAMATRKGVDLCGIPELCFPDGFHLDTEGKPDSFHFLVLTDIHGNREQGVVLRVYRELQVPQDTEPVGAYPRPRAPVAICLISKFPYYSALKDCLSCVLPELRACGQQEFERKVRVLAAQLTLVPCPPPGSLQLCFELGPIIVVLPPPEDVDTPPIDISLHLPLLCFSPSTVLQIVTCLLTERRLVFVSRDWPLLTLMTECFVYYLRPLPWRHPYIPVLASSMLDMLMAPTVFLMGCHSRHIRTVIELEELVLVDIDTGTVVFPQNPEFHAPPLPTAITEEFITSVRRLRLHPELASASLPICTGLAAVRQRDLHRRQQINSHVQRIFLQLIGSLLRDVTKYLNLKHRVFIKKDFLDSREPASQPFYISHLRTDLFHCFLKARLNDRVDAFSRWEMATRPQTPRLNAELSPTGHSSPFTSDAARTIDDHMSQEPSLATSLTSHPPADPGNTGVRVRPTVVPRCLYLPPLPSAPLDDLSVSLFYTKLVVDITRELEGVGGDDGGVRAVCLYLRGVVRLCQGQPVPALLDFQSLEKIDMDFFPLELVRQTLESMSTEQLRALQETEGLKGLLHGVLEKHWDRARPEHSVRDLELPVWPLDRQQFTALAQAAGLVSTTITADCLFDILAAGESQPPSPLHTEWSSKDQPSLQLAKERQLVKIAGLERS
ncbi:DENN domain-containing protein 3-like [Amblyraja radiata]|uniref:DENN domain-containing protein 3-like n=1 Tax=Amblyraja radiata TaxID=386614 RepID=UPI0014028166|nr:DENN domain-containing protein 3-like [Amblyraja radiata]